MSTIETDLSDLAIKLEHVSVLYQLPRERIGTFKEYTIRWLQRKIEHQNFLALDDINLDVFHGEVVGFIGHNGAGKSTLLKLISKVLRPTLGRVWVRGRVAPLLELGAGFHMELTGRENIYLNGAILGFSREQMRQKVSRIIEFAELQEFIDAPIRTYSSGMLARLGFAVATDEKPDILIIDEILAVGDVSFQRKSFARIEEFCYQGATVLLVSHDLKAVENMCQRVVWLNKGHIHSVGTPQEVLPEYRKAFQ